jgi:aldose 1-epimerase
LRSSSATAVPSPPEDLIPLRAGDLALLVDPAKGGRAVSWQVGGHELLTSNGDHPVESGMYPMAPWAGRLRGNSVDGPAGRCDLPATYEQWALHGTVLAASAEVLRSHTSASGADLLLSVRDHPNWPWPMDVLVGWQVQNSRVTTTLEVRSLEGTFPVVLGWHPWFKRRLDVGQSAQWWVDATHRVERGSDALPTGNLLPFDAHEGPYDDAFSVATGRARIEWPNALSIDIHSDGPWFVVYDQPEHCLCIEPQSGPPDGLRPWPWWPTSEAAPDSPVRMTVSWDVKHLG